MNRRKSKTCASSSLYQKPSRLQQLLALRGEVPHLASELQRDEAARGPLGWRMAMGRIPAEPMGSHFGVDEHPFYHLF